MMQADSECNVKVLRFNWLSSGLGNLKTFQCHKNVKLTFGHKIEPDF